MLINLNLMWRVNKNEHKKRYGMKRSHNWIDFFLTADNKKVENILRKGCQLVWYTQYFDYYENLNNKLNKKTN
jgi:hypothetical protein